MPQELLELDNIFKQCIASSEEAIQELKVLEQRKKKKSSNDNTSPKSRMQCLK